MSVFSNKAFHQHELVTFAEDRDSGLRAIIAVHNSQLGVATGGCRMFPYASEEDAIFDVLRLSRGMTYKSALAGLPFGGGKSVIIGDPRRDKTPQLLRAMGDFIDSLGGRYVAAEDSGIGVADMRMMASRTRFVSGIQEGRENAGDPSPSTAYGVYVGIRSAVKYRLGRDSLQGMSVAIQGLGNVGFHLAGLLANDGVQVFGADVNEENLLRAKQEHGVIPVPPADILSLQVDVVSPCAMGAVLTAEVIAKLRTGIVAGAANNQLPDQQEAELLWNRGILYCPDFLINAGGIIDVYHQGLGSDPKLVKQQVERIALNLEEILRRSDETQRPANVIAQELAREYHSAALARAHAPVTAAG